MHKSKSFPLPRARDVRNPKVQILHVQILQVGALHGIDISNRAFVGLFCNPAGVGEWSAGCYGRGAGCVQVLPENPCLTRSDFQESCRLTLSNIPKRAIGYLECARIAFIWSGNGYVACKV